MGTKFNVGDKWILGTVLCNAGAISYQDMTTNGVFKKHLVNLRKKEAATNETIYLKIRKTTKDLIPERAGKDIANSLIMKIDQCPNPARTVTPNLTSQEYFYHYSKIENSIMTH